MTKMFVKYFSFFSLFFFIQCAKGGAASNQQKVSPDRPTDGPRNTPQSSSNLVIKKETDTQIGIQSLDSKAVLPGCESKKRLPSMDKLYNGGVYFEGKPGFEELSLVMDQQILKMEMLLEKSLEINFRLVGIDKEGMSYGDQLELQDGQVLNQDSIVVGTYTLADQVLSLLVEKQAIRHFLQDETWIIIPEIGAEPWLALSQKKTVYTCTGDLDYVVLDDDFPYEDWLHYLIQFYGQKLKDRPLFVSSHIDLPEIFSIETLTGSKGLGDFYQFHQQFFQHYLKKDSHHHFVPELLFIGIAKKIFSPFHLDAFLHNQVDIRGSWMLDQALLSAEPIQLLDQSLDDWMGTQTYYPTFDLAQFSRGWIEESFDYAPEYHPIKLKDRDGDGLTDFKEWLLGTDPDLVDTDQDLVSDYFEYRTNPDGLTSYLDPKGHFVDLTWDGLANEWAPLLGAKIDAFPDASSSCKSSIFQAAVVHSPQKTMAMITGNLDPKEQPSTKIVLSSNDRLSVLIWEQEFHSKAFKVSYYVNQNLADEKTYYLPFANLGDQAEWLIRQDDFPLKRPLEARIELSVHSEFQTKICQNLKLKTVFYNSQ